MNAVEVGKEGGRTGRAAALAGTPFGVLGTMALACAAALAIGFAVASAFGVLMLLIVIGLAAEHGH